MTTNHIEVRESGSMSFVGPQAVNVFRATVIASGLRLYARTGMKPNRAYTPKAMMEVAAQITGQTFKARDYMGASEALLKWAQDMRKTIDATNALDPDNGGQS